jgi:HEAT repeat protein
MMVVLGMLFLALHPLASNAADPSLDDLLYDATRYGDTPARREAREVAKATLLERMPEAMHAAMRHVHGDNIMIQVLLMEWVQSQPGDVITPVLIDYLEDEREQARRLAIFFLGFHDTPEHAEKIMPHLEDEATRGAALRTLGKWQVPEARLPAERWLREGKERLRVVAANALRDLGDHAAIPALTAALGDPFFTVRHAAARAVVLLAGDDPSLLPATAPNQRLLERIKADAGISEPARRFHLDGRFFLP